MYEVQWKNISINNVDLIKEKICSLIVYFKNESEVFSNKKELTNLEEDLKLSKIFHYSYKWIDILSDADFYLEWCELLWKNEKIEEHFNKFSETWIYHKFSSNFKVIIPKQENTDMEVINDFFDILKGRNCSYSISNHFTTNKKEEYVKRFKNTFNKISWFDDTRISNDYSLINYYLWESNDNSMVFSCSSNKYYDLLTWKEFNRTLYTNIGKSTQIWHIFWWDDLYYVGNIWDDVLFSWDYKEFDINMIIEISKQSNSLTLFSENILSDINLNEKLKDYYNQIIEKLYNYKIYSENNYELTKLMKNLNSIMEMNIKPENILIVDKYSIWSNDDGTFEWEEILNLSTLNSEMKKDLLNNWDYVSSSWINPAQWWWTRYIVKK